MARRKEYLPIDTPALKTYHDQYDLLRVRSQILNAGNQRPNAYSIFLDKQGLEHQILKRKGDVNGYVFKQDNNVGHLAILPELENKLHDLEAEFQEYKDHRILHGYDEPSEYTKDLQEKRLKLEAEIDVVNEELTVCEKLLEKLHLQPERQKRNDLMLINGLKCGIIGDPPHEIDGQRVTQIGKLSIITDPDSPYHGMSLGDYRKLAKEWKQRSFANIGQYFIINFLNQPAGISQLVNFFC